MAFATYHRGYGVIQGTRPQTIGYSLADTPVGLAAWLLDHDTATYEHLAQLFSGHPFGAIKRDDWLDNTSLYWFTNTPTSAARLYWQQATAGGNFYAAADLSFPAAVTVFAEEYVHAPRSWTEKAYHNLIYFNGSRKRRPLRRLGTTATVFRRAPRGVPHTTLKEMRNTVLQVRCAA